MGNNVFSSSKNDLTTLVGVGCPAHILYNCLDHGTNPMTIVESIIYKTYQYFCIYTVSAEELKDYCYFVDIEYRKLLSHRVTRWLSLYPSLSRMLQMYPALSLVYTNLNCQLRGASPLVSSIVVERRRCALQVSSVARLQENKER